MIYLKQEGACLDFLGYTFRYDLDRHGGTHRYLNLTPSKKSVAAEKETLRRMTSSRMCFKPIPTLIEEINRHLRGWANYFSQGYPRKEFRTINTYVRLRLFYHLRRRSQRPFRPPEGVTQYNHLKKMGLVML